MHRSGVPGGAFEQLGDLGAQRYPDRSEAATRRNFRIAQGGSQTPVKPLPLSRVGTRQADSAQVAWPRTERDPLSTEVPSH